MNSIGKECQDLKCNYEECFNKWFATKFLKGIKDDPCAPLFNSYQECVKKALKEKNINLEDLQENVLGTSREKIPPS